MRQIQLLALFVTALMMSQLLVVGPVRGQDDNEREIRGVHLNLKPNDVLSPETNPDGEAEPERKRVMAQYDQYPMTRANRRQVDAGTWTTGNIGGAMMIEAGTFIFNVWSQEYQSDYEGQPDWEFYLYHNDEQIAYASVSNAPSSKDRPVEVRANGNIATARDVRTGDTLKINIKYTAWEDCDIYFNTLEYDSGGTGRMDSIQILWARGTTEVRFFDTFGINWQTQGKFFCSVSTSENVWYGDINTDAKEGANHEDSQGRSYRTTIITFRNLDISSGTDITVTITYSPSESGSEGWSVSYRAGGSSGTGGGGDKDDDDDLPVELIAGGVVVLVLVVVLAYLFVFKKRAGHGEEGEDEEGEEGEDEEGEEDEDEEGEEDEG